jgi:ferredoxin/flavodoxin---NADP+ reductase
VSTQLLTFQSRVVEHRQLSPFGHELTLTREGLACEAGRLITIHGRDATENRAYTLCNGERDEHLQILFRHIPTGKLTPQLAKVRAGDSLAASGPYGEFVVRDPARPLVFCATGTGVAPARAYRRSHPGLDLTLIHGVRYGEDLFYRDEFAPDRYFPCVSGEAGPWFRGRLTEFFRSFECDPASHFYLCGANEMVFDMHSLLKDRGVDDACIFTEAYYYRLYS